MMGRTGGTRGGLRGARLSRPAIFVGNEDLPEGNGDVDDGNCKNGGGDGDDNGDGGGGGGGGNRGGGDTSRDQGGDLRSSWGARTPPREIGMWMRELAGTVVIPRRAPFPTCDLCGEKEPPRGK